MNDRKRFPTMEYQRDKKNMRATRVLHIDMDAFFAAIEQRDQPFLRNRPVVIGGPPGSRGVASTCSYEARKYGVHSAMPLQQVQKLCPQAIFLPVNARKYVHVSKQVMAILERFSPRVEPISVDEAFMDLTGLNRIYKSERELALRIKQAIREEVRLTCSIGIASTRILAKLASGLEKPDGLTIIAGDEIEEKVHPLPVRKLWGIGEATEKALHKLGIHTIGELARFPEARLKQVFGKNGPTLARAAAGNLDSPVHSLQELPPEKSVGHEHTFWNDTDDYEQIRAQLLILAQRVGRRLRNKNFRGRTVTLKLRYDNFQTTTHRTSLQKYTSNEMEIFSVAEELFRQIYQKKRRIRLIGVSVSNLLQNQHWHLSLPFQEERRSLKSDLQLLPTIDKIKDTFGENAIWRATSLQIFDPIFHNH